MPTRVTRVTRVVQLQTEPFVSNTVSVEQVVAGSLKYPTLMQRYTQIPGVQSQGHPVWSLAM